MIDNNKAPQELKIPIKECIKKYLKEKKVSGKMQKTIDQYTYLLDRFAIKFGNVQINQLDKEELIDWIHSDNFLKHTGKQQGMASRHNMVIILKSFFKRFDKESILKSVKIDYNSNNVSIKPVGVEWLKKKIMNSPLEWKVILSLLVSSGLRANEMLNVKIEDIDFDENTIEIVSKGKKISENRDVVPFSPSTKKYLLEWIKQNNLIKENNLITMKYWTFWYKMKKIYEISPHQLRHTFCTELDVSGFSPTQIKILARHKHIKTTEKYMNPDRKEILKKYKEDPLDI